MFKREMFHYNAPGGGGGGGGGSSVRSPEEGSEFDSFEETARLRGGEVVQNHKALAEAIRLLALVILALGLITAGFYANEHNVDATWFWGGAGFVIIVGILFD